MPSACPNVSHEAYRVVAIQASPLRHRSEETKICELAGISKGTQLFREIQMLRLDLGNPTVNPDPSIVASAKVGENLESPRVIEPNSAAGCLTKQKLGGARHARARGLLGRGHAWP